MPRGTTRTVHPVRTKEQLRLDRVEAAAGTLWDIFGDGSPWRDQEAETKDAWRWRAERTLDAAANAGGRGKSRKT